MLKAINIKLYPNSKQIQILASSFGCCRKIYNLALDKSIESYKENGKCLTSMADFTNLLFKQFLKDETLLFLHNENTKILKGSLKNLAEAYTNFFRRLKNKESKNGFPKFKKKSNKQTLNLEKLAFSKKVLDIPNKLFISKKYGFIRYITSDENIKYISRYKNSVHNITIVKLPSDEYYARLLIDSNDIKELPITDRHIGIDLGVKNMLITSDGEVFENKHFFKNAEKRIKHLQRELSRKKRSSNNYNKIRIKIAKKYQYIINSKKDYINVITNILINDNQVICMEDLNVKGMMKNHNLAKSIQEMNFGEFKRILQYKCDWYGRRLIQVDRFYPSSKRCNVCGYVNKELSLSDREWTCPKCGTKHDRDINAAMNILSEGERIIGSRTAEFTLMER